MTQAQTLPCERIIAEA